MYVDRKKRSWPKVLLVLGAVLVLAGLWRLRVPASGQDMEEEAVAAMRAAVERSARQCYVVEGAYPSSLSYLEENYGLQVNSEDFYIVYDIFASNMPPAVRVVKR